MSKVILYMAVSIDGFIADELDQTSWSSEAWNSYRSFVRTCDVCIIGSNTYRTMRDGNEFIDDTVYMVATSDQSKDTGIYQKISINSKQDMPEGGKIGILGGSDLNSRIASLGLLDEIILDIDPIVIGKGKPLFSDKIPELKLRLFESKTLGTSTIQNHYKVLRQEF